MKAIETYRPYQSERDRIRRHIERQRLFHEQAQPFYREMARVCGTPRLTMQDGKVIAHETIYTPEQGQFLDTCRESLRVLQESIFAWEENNGI